jgi:hypothetical protein
MHGIAFANLVESTTDPQAFYYNLAVSILQIAPIIVAGICAP